jgi:hypothetical protein
MSPTFGILFSVPCVVPIAIGILQNFYAAIINSRTKSEANVGRHVLNARIILNTFLFTQKALLPIQMLFINFKIFHLRMQRSKQVTILGYLIIRSTTVYPAHDRIFLRITKTVIFRHTAIAYLTANRRSGIEDFRINS